MAKTSRHSLATSRCERD